MGEFAYPAALDGFAISILILVLWQVSVLLLLGQAELVNQPFFIFLRFYDPLAGAVRVGGTNLCDLSLTELREHIGLVPQETALFSSTLRDNIAFGKPDADEATIIAAAKQAQAHEFIMAIDGGYNAYVGKKVYGYRVDSVNALQSRGQFCGIPVCFFWTRRQVPLMRNLKRQFKVR